REEDASTLGSRNPLASGQLPLSLGVAVFAVLAAGSAASLLLVSARDVYIALLVYGLYWGYSWGPGFRARPGVDVAVHGAVPALFVLMGASLAGVPTEGGVVLAGIVFSLAAMSGVLQEVRDLDRDAPSRRTTALILGKEMSVDLALLMMGAGVALYAVAAIAGGLPPAMLALVPFSWFLVAPILSLRKGEETADAVIRAIRARGLVLAVGALLLYLGTAAATI
ncbi:MAG: UbiA prenyltransferase family protein, partial [Thaumarchaeota archaeon]|nr:UbiA prenyltransferase family protein [Nitrososphaerota archaeon]